MASSQIIYGDSIQDRLERLSVERLDRISGIASKYLGSSKTSLYELIIDDEIICAIDFEIANVLSETFVKLTSVK